MSRHDLQPKQERPDVVCAAIGWDRPLQTFFAQIFFRTDEAPDEGQALIWVGTEPGELLTAEAAIAIVAPYAHIPDDLAARLSADMNATRGVKDGAYQIEAKKRLFGSIH